MKSDNKNNGSSSQKGTFENQTFKTGNEINKPGKTSMPPEKNKHINAGSTKRNDETSDVQKKR